MSKSKHIALLTGGLSSERDVSISSGKGVEKSLKELGHRVTVIDVGHDLAEVLSKTKPDLAFNALHGTYGEDGCVQGVLELLGIPYTHSGVMASAIAMDKQMTKYIVQNVGISCAEGKVISKEDIAIDNIPIKRPIVIKPVAEGSSVGIYILKEGDKTPSIEELAKFKDLIVEKYIPGKELSVAVTDNEPLGVIELRPKKGFYTYENKYTDGKTEHFMPAPIEKKVYNEAMELAHKAHKTLKCRGISRTDFRYDVDGDGKLYFLELNTHPGMTPLSLVPEIASHKGISYTGLVEYLVGKAQCDK
ncbi:MAG: D-alanine--D-alanine ligase [Rickettsiaceae bacterium]|jgi:D-alanine-D-alanine ligase|nr:D-alanine--D-alanine ligase [Rickettsiaceae bacterium]